MKRRSERTWLKLGLCLSAVLLASVPMVTWAQAEPSSGDLLQRVLLLRDPNTRVVLLGTSLLGLSGGLVGIFMLLRKRSLIADVVGHSALPGIAMAFILTQMAAPGSPKNLGALLLGAFITGLAGAGCVLLLNRYTRIKSDAALAIVLSVFYGLGAALLTVIQRIPTASAAGLNSFLNGKTASLVDADVWVFAGAAAVLVVLTLLFFKEFTLLCFDGDFAAASGWPVVVLDTLLTGLVVGVTIVGMETVGLILVVAILVIPASAARFWTDDVRRMTIVSGVIGAVSAALGTLLSALGTRVAAGAVMVLCGAGMFLVSLLFGSRRGLLWRELESRQLRRRVGRHDLLRAIYEWAENQRPDSEATESALLSLHVRIADLTGMRAWTPARIHQSVRAARRDDLVEVNADGSLRLTPEGAALARRAVRNHRLWEMYLISYADIAPSHVDCDADRIEHALGVDIVRELEERLMRADEARMPASPHALPSVSQPDSASNQEPLP